MHIFDELKERGLVFQTTDEAALRKALEEGQVSYYTGYDPTADSLHLGHLVAILTSRRLQLNDLTITRRFQRVVPFSRSNPEDVATIQQWGRSVDRKSVV